MEKCLQIDRKAQIHTFIALIPYRVKYHIYSYTYVDILLEYGENVREKMKLNIISGQLHLQATLCIYTKVHIYTQSHTSLLLTCLDSA